MRYALVDIKKGEDFGFDPYLHRISAGRMVVNENELMTVDKSPSVAAEILGSKLMSSYEIINILNKQK